MTPEEIAARAAAAGNNGSTALNWTTQFNNVATGLTSGFADVWNALKNNTPTYNINTPAGSGAPGTAAAGSSNTMLWVGIIILIIILAVGAVLLTRK
jgi:hypothetical protein